MPPLHCGQSRQFSHCRVWAAACRPYHGFACIFSVRAAACRPYIAIDQGNSRIGGRGRQHAAPIMDLRVFSACGRQHAAPTSLGSYCRARAAACRPYHGFACIFSVRAAACRPYHGFACIFSVRAAACRPYHGFACIFSVRAAACRPYIGESHQFSYLQGASGSMPPLHWVNHTNSRICRARAAACRPYIVVDQGNSRMAGLQGAFETLSLCGKRPMLTVFEGYCA